MTAKDTAEPTLAITEQAIEKVRGFRAQSEDPESQALWVEVSGVSDGEYVYKISLNALHVARQDDVVQRHGDLAIVVPESSVEKLRGATIDWSEGLAQSGLALVNPNKPPAPAELPMMSPPVAPPASPPRSRSLRLTPVSSGRALGVGGGGTEHSAPWLDEFVPPTVQLRTWRRWRRRSPSSPTGREGAGSARFTKRRDAAKLYGRLL